MERRCKTNRIGLLMLFEGALIYITRSKTKRQKKNLFFFPCVLKHMKTTYVLPRGNKSIEYYLPGA